MTRGSKRLAGLALGLALAIPTGAYAFRAFNHLEVRPVDQTSFEVLQSGGTSAADFWCAAGDYALRALGAAANQPVYIVEGKHVARTRANRYAVTFSLTAPPEASNFTTKPLTLDFNAVGDNLRASFAQQYCYDRLGNDKWRN